MGGYSIGYFLVKWFIEKHNETLIENMTSLPSEQFLAY
ncbi:DUF2268 domain-containing putative Zn-dependent protease [Fictibacillus sp. CENA-BCM004]|uniref:DUF2268 domain-containing putative Zn-dependent protease n=1 Tax=Fictibacillus terranigra TaxID=3058424 RepID=A0ABT8EDR1_9BACL|nr:DUF2268 domain-containing putative Zn-dependent protease [Fictibacillus sp. CENA-BCM004]MDN4076063.1 DUF2268 domain-containing putative Zn-dependent protease [Fictibacillus sp. CENA-BCM004]